MECEFIGIVCETPPLDITPDINAARIRQGLKQGGFPGPIFADKQCHRSLKDDGLGLLEDRETERITILIRIFFRIKCYVPQVHFYSRFMNYCGLCRFHSLFSMESPKHQIK